MSKLDGLVESAARGLARRIGRRRFIARLGVFLAGASAGPLLPVARGGADEGAARTPADPAGKAGDPRRCEYWRHCAIDGFLCSCCGGDERSCPPGTEMSPVTWIGTCRNPADGKDYLIWYNDCCGKSYCGRCFCNRNEGERPVYHPYRNNDINWCGGAESQIYNCSIALLIGPADERQPES